jgi:hypothetical protein
MGGAALRVAVKGDLDRQESAQEPIAINSSRKPTVTSSATPRGRPTRVQHMLQTPYPLPSDSHVEMRLKSNPLSEAVSSTGYLHGPQQLAQSAVPLQESTHRAWRVLADAMPEIQFQDEAATATYGWRAAREAVFSPASNPSSTLHNGLGLPNRIERLSSSSNGLLTRRSLQEILVSIDAEGTDWKVWLH